VQPGARILLRLGKTTTEFQHWNILNAPRFQSIIHEMCMFLAFSSEHMCSDLIRQIKSLLSLNWQVLNVFIVKFQASTSNQCHHLLINLSCISAQYCTWARSHRDRHYDCTCYTVFTRFWILMYTNTACSIEAEQRLCSEALTSEVGLLQNFRA